MTFSRNTILSAIPFLAGIITWVLIEMAVLSGVILFATQLLLFLSIIFIIWEGSNLLVKSSQDLAKHFQVSSFLIGLTIVAFGTSLPELATSLMAGIGGKGDIAVANVVGSNILNISVILGGVAFFTKEGLAITRQTIRLDAPILLLGSLLVLLFLGQVPFKTELFENIKYNTLFNLKLDIIEAVILLAVFIIYLYIIISKRKKVTEDPVQLQTAIDHLHQQHKQLKKVNAKNQKTLLSKIISILAGLTIVMLGCHVLVGEVNIINGVITGYGAVWFASVFGIPDYLIGLSIVALGTSAPEMVVSLSASRSNAIEIGLGNLLGSAIFNIFAVLGLAGLLIQPPLTKAITIHAEALQSLIAMGLLIIMLYIFLKTSQRLSRKEGFILLCSGVAYMIYEMVNNIPRNSL